MRTPLALAAAVISLVSVAALAASPASATCTPGDVSAKRGVSVELPHCPQNP